MINNRFIHINSKETFNSTIDQISSESLVFIKDAQAIHTHDTTYNYVAWSILSSPEIKHSSDTVAGDLVLFNSVIQEICFVSPSKLTVAYSNGHVPIGVVVVPGTHDVYGDGSCGVMSLKAMDFNNPMQGGEDTPMY